MKKLILFTSALFIFLTSINAQRIDYEKIRGNEYFEYRLKTEYKFPQYTKANIVFKNGETGRARVNYNNYRQQMTYIGEKGDTLEIANAADIDFITTGLDSIFYDNGYYEWVASSGSARLAVKHVYKEVDRSLTGPFGTSSPARHVETRDVIQTTSDNKKLSPDQIITISKETTYYISNIKNGKGSFVKATKNNIDKLFPKMKVEDFIDDNKLNLNKEKDLVDLMVYISRKK